MKRFKRILCFVGTQSSETAISRAVSLAISNHATLVIMDVVKPIPRAIGLMTDAAAPADLEALVIQDHRRKLLDRMSAYCDTAVEMRLVVKTGDPATEVIREVIQGDIDLVIKTADGFSPTGRLFGSVARMLLRMCPCPVWVLKPEIHGPFDRVLAAIDLDTEDECHHALNHEIMQLAFSVAQNETATLHVVSAWDLWMERPLRSRAGDEAVDLMIQTKKSKNHKAMDELLQPYLAQDDSIEIFLKHGDAARVIRGVADRIEADLLVMGTVCRTGVSGFLIGNTAELIISELTCSMLALKPKGFVSPIQTVNTTSVHCEAETL